TARRHVGGRAAPRVSRRRREVRGDPRRRGSWRALARRRSTARSALAARRQGRVSELRVRSGDVELGVRTWGDAAAPRGAIVLVHGFPDNSLVWEPIAQRLAKRFYVVAYDVRGAGTSTAPAHDRDYALDHLSDDLAAVIDATC